MAALLQATLSDTREAPLAASMRGLLLAFAQGRAGRDALSPSASAPLIEPLSPQEQRVLRLLSAGRSNPEIASELIVSINTVKTQVQSIYRKLNVSSRREACDAARQFQLL
jgi:LuxR family maltose regulon positive regulatory protein